MKFSGTLALILFCVAAPATAQSLQSRVEARLAAAGPGPRFGLVVATEDGRELIAIAPDARFVPASNTKVLTTATAFAARPAIDTTGGTGGTTVRPDADARPDSATMRAPRTIRTG